MYNLLNEKWIPVSDKEGNIHVISCSEITDPRWVDLAPPRADFRGALYEFLIGILQTTSTPSERKWKEWMVAPPSKEILQTNFDQISDAFNLDGDGYRFLQDSSTELSGTKRIEQLLLEAPGDQTLKHNKDHFLKRPDFASYLSYEMIAMALITRAQYDPGFGGGFRGALRGPGALVSILKRDNLWETLWINVLVKDDFNRDITLPEKDNLPSLFAWMGPCQTSEKGTLPVSQEDVHPFASFWGAPNRVRIDFQSDIDQRCLISGEKIIKGASSLTAQRYGTNYEGRFFHPLSPFTFNPDDSPPTFYFTRGKQLSGRGSTFRSWLGVGVPNPKRHVSSAETIKRYRASKDRRAFDVRISCYGFELRQALALAWHEIEFPCLDFGEEDTGPVSNFASQLVQSADIAVLNLRSAIQRALYEKNVDGKWEGGSTSISGKTFWQQTEANFWQGLNNAFFSNIEKFLAGTDSKTLRKEWLADLQQTIKKEFNHVIWSGDSRATDPKSAALARSEMWIFTSAYSKKIREILDMEKPEKKSK